MKQLTCEMCGGTDMLKEGGVFVCQSCGVKYSVEEAKKMMIEGTVEVTGTVAVDRSGEVEALHKRMTEYLQKSDFLSAYEYAERILDIDPEYAPAYIGKFCFSNRIKSEEDIAKYSAETLERNENFQKALRFAKSPYKEKLEEFLRQAQEHDNDRTAYLTPIRKTLPNGKVALGRRHVVAVKADGTVAAYVEGREAGRKDWKKELSTWNNIVAVAVGDNHIVGLNANGTVKAFLLGIDNTKATQCNVGGWRNIVAIAAGDDYTVGLKSDGSITAVGNFSWQNKAAIWNNIVAIHASRYFLSAVKSDGAAISQKRDVYNTPPTVYDTNDVVDMVDGYMLRANGRVSGDKRLGDVSDIVAFTKINDVLLLLKPDGSLDRFFNGVIIEGYEGLRDIVAISAAFPGFVALKRDGTAIASVNSVGMKAAVNSWSDLAVCTDEEHRANLQRENAPEKLQQLQLAERQKVEKWKADGLCPHCGGQLGGLFSKKCKSCGKAP